MNWKLIFLLSSFGLLMAFLTVFFIPTHYEPWFWLVIFIYCAYMIAKTQPNRLFLHGFLVSMVNSIWITIVHVLFFMTYMGNHPDMVQMALKMPYPNHPRLMMLVTGPVYGVIFGLVLGLFAVVAGLILKKKSQ